MTDHQYDLVFAGFCCGTAADLAKNLAGGGLIAAVLCGLLGGAAAIAIGFHLTGRQERKERGI